MKVRVFSCYLLGGGGALVWMCKYPGGYSGKLEDHQSQRQPGGSMHAEAGSAEVVQLNMTLSDYSVNATASVVRRSEVNCDV